METEVQLGRQKILEMDNNVNVPNATNGTLQMVQMSSFTACVFYHTHVHTESPAGSLARVSNSGGQGSDPVSAGGV